MKFTFSWLTRFLHTKASLTEIVNALNAIGLKVEKVINRAEELRSFTVAHILKTTKHPDANKLQICEVDIGDRLLQIICGAQNARADLKVVLAPIGAVIPNGNFKIKEAEIRKIKSYGMLCSEAELLIGANASDIIELPKGAKVGEQFAKYYGLDDPVIDIEVTPNRGDALGVYGIARDLAAKGIGELKPLAIPTLVTDFATNFTVEVDNQQACPYFAMQEIRGLQNLPSPDWLQKLLTNIGINPISTVVDVASYITVSFNQPIHVYDRSKLAGCTLKVELLKNSSNFKALNNKEYQLTAGDLVIKDERHVQCLAGIIGADDSACNLHTKDIVLEAACFDPIKIIKSGRKHNITTDARHRFERNIDITFTNKALKLAAQLIQSICGGKSGAIIAHGDAKRPLNTLEFSLDFFAKLTGLTIPTLKICHILEKLGFIVKEQQGILYLTIPQWRADIAIKEDVVEEIMRIYGYDKLPPTLLPLINVEKIVPQEQRRYSDIKRVLATQGYDEIVTWSFMDKRLAKLFTNIKDELILQNPISAELNYMRPSILPNLLNAAGKNFARSFKNIALFELGPVFSGSKPEDAQVYVSGIRSGFNSVKTAHQPGVRKIDVFDIKSDLAVLLDFLNINIDSCQINDAQHLAYYHLTRAATLQFANKTIGSFGQLNPLVLKHFAIEQDIVAFELNLANILYSKSKYGFRERFIASNFQVTTRDFAFIVAKDTSVGDILTTISNIDKKLIKSVELFDIYAGDKIAGDKKSIAISVQLQAEDKTLTEDDLVLLSQSIITKVANKFNAKLRTPDDVKS